MAEKKRARRAHPHDSAAPAKTTDPEAASIQDAADITHLADAEHDETPAGHSDEPTQDGAARAEQFAGRKVTRKALMDRLFSKSEEITKLSKQNREMEAKLKETNDKWLRTAADFENYRKRTRKEWDLLKQQAKAEILLEILNVVDDFERAFAVGESGESDGYVAGFRLIYNNLIQVLERAGVREFDALHKPFDPRFHMAVGQVEREDLAAGAVAEVLQKGYHLDDTVIRPASVLVAK